MAAFLVKTIVILLLVAAIFGGAAYYANELFLKPTQALKDEKAAPPTPPPPDPSLPAFTKAMAVADSGDLLAGREALARFVEQNVHSSKLDDAKDRLGKINTDIFLKPLPAPEKQVYVVRSGDVLNKVARLTKTTPELLMRANGMTNIILRINQQILYTPADFSLDVAKTQKKVTLLNHGKFFKQYPILALHGAALPKQAKGKNAVKPGKQQGKVLEKIAWAPSGGRVIFTDKEFSQATFWVSFTVSGNTLYGEPAANSGIAPNRPPVGGIGLPAEGVAELAAMLVKGASVTIEP